MVGISNKEYKEVLENILTAQPVYVKDIGTKVIVTRYSRGDADRVSKSGEHICNITFLELPNAKAIHKTKNYTVNLEYNPGAPIPNTLGGQPIRSRNSVHANGYDIYINAEIHIKDLRAVPFKSAASKLLYGKSKKTT